MKWKFYRAAYGGATELVEAGFIQKHERESAENYNKRVAEAYGFSYSRSIVDLISYYLFKCPPQFRVGFLAKDPLWQLFVKDCNLRGEELDEYLVERQLEASIYGHIGLLVDKPEGEVVTKEEEISKRIYPYLSVYTPISILDYEEERDEWGRPYLVMLKLKEDENRYRVWTREKWEIWEESEEEEAVLLKQGLNKIGVIPFVFFLY